MFALDRLQEMAAAGQDATEVTRLSIRAIERGRADIRDVQFAVEEHAAKFEEWLAESGAWDERAVTAAAQHLIDNQRALRRESEAKVAKMKRAVTLAEWKTLTVAEQEAACRVANPKAKLNKQDNDAIEWARWSWNPVTGCLHNCPYCYARDLAEKYYPQKFEPSIVPEALSAPLNAAPPKEAAMDLGLKNIFTCSMADLFGNWVPKEWIETVLGITRQAKQWNFLILTKFPQRLAEFEFPDNVWTGTTVDCQARVAVAERAMRQVRAAVKWVSIEPMIEPIAMDFSVVQWVVIGGARASTQTPAWRPPRRWVIDATHRAMPVSPNPEAELRPSPAIELPIQAEDGIDRYRSTTGRSSVPRRQDRGLCCYLCENAPELEQIAPARGAERVAQARTPAAGTWSCHRCC